MTFDYERNQKMAKFKKGDIVHVFRTCYDHENGWDNSWPREMNRFVGQHGIITEITKQAGIRIDFECDTNSSHHELGGRFQFPYFCLKLVR